MTGPGVRSEQQRRFLESETSVKLGIDGEDGEKLEPRQRWEHARSEKPPRGWLLEGRACDHRKGWLVYRRDGKMPRDLGRLRGDSELATPQMLGLRRPIDKPHRTEIAARHLCL